MKIKTIRFNKFRGSRKETGLNFKNQESALIYGDNGTGKSSFLDAIEWFITDNVSHLSGEEIEKHGGLRNMLSEDNDESYVEIKFSNQSESKKKLELKGGRLKVAHSNTDAQFSKMLEKFKGEKLWIRNRELVAFILNTKKDRLSDISSIIGYDEIDKTKSILKKALGDIKTLIRNKNYDGQMNGKKKIIRERAKQTVNNESEFYGAIESLIKPLLNNASVTDEASYDNALKLLKTGADSKKLAYRQTLEKTKKEIDDCLVNADSLILQLANLHKSAETLQSDRENIENISLVNLYEEAKQVLAYRNEDSCPLCLSRVKRSDLLDSINKKLNEFDEFSSLVKKFEEDKNSTLLILKQVKKEVKACNELLEKPLKQLSVSTQQTLDIISKIDEVEKELVKDISKLSANVLEIKKELFDHAFSDSIAKIKIALDSEENDDNSKKIDVIAKITVSKQAFDDLTDLEKEQKILEEQRVSMDKIVSEFNLKQKQELVKFLAAISKDLNDYYLFMNNNEKVDNIELVTVDNTSGEFAGIAIKLNFHGEEITSPKKYLSESHINCLGLSLFLSSVRLFNSEAKFLILDDVISSFDKPHRYRFGQLLQEKFKDYQLIVLTHEYEWFELMVSKFKGQGWQINSVKWSVENGIETKIPLVTYEERINKKIDHSDEDGLGNLLRKYAENILKELCSRLEAKMPFRYNDSNENRNLDELFYGFRKRLKGKTSLASNDIIQRLADSKFFENRASHDGAYKENLSDLKPIYIDIKAFYNLFRCESGSCKQTVSMKFYNPTTSIIACKCGVKQVDWKKKN